MPPIDHLQNPVETSIHRVSATFRNLVDETMKAGQPGTRGSAKGHSGQCLRLKRNPGFRSTRLLGT